MARTSRVDKTFWRRANTYKVTKKDASQESAINVSQSSIFKTLDGSGAISDEGMFCFTIG
jgi:hypothetical protein